MAEQPGKPTISFFSHLRQLAASVDRQVTQLNTEYEKTDREFCYPVVMKEISDMKHKTRDLSKKVSTEATNLAKSETSISDIVRSVNTFLESQYKQLAKTEQHLKQYGFKTWDEVQMEKREREAEKADSGNAAQDKIETEILSSQTVASTLPTTTKPIQVDPPRTPRLEDTGISMATLQYLNSLAKQKHTTTTITATPKMTDKDGNPANRVFDDSDVPSVFRHNGIMTTPSLFRELGLNMNTTFDPAGMATPLADKATLPVTDHVQSNLKANPVTKLVFDIKSSPVTPQFITQDIERILTGQKGKVEHCSNRSVSKKRPVNVGLFQSSRDHAEKQAEPACPSMSTCYDGMPQEPELTYSLQELSEMTGMFQINPLRDPPQLLSSLQYGSDKENVTPPEPELLSERISHVKVDKDVSAKLTETKCTLYDSDLPATPKLLGSYPFLQD